MVASKSHSKARGREGEGDRQPNSGGQRGKETREVNSAQRRAPKYTALAVNEGGSGSTRKIGPTAQEGVLRRKRAAVPRKEQKHRKEAWRIAQRVAKPEQG